MVGVELWGSGGVKNIVMARGLLLGNGINAHLGIKDLSVGSIAERFKRNILIYSKLIYGIFGVNIAEDFFKSVDMQTSNLGIETLAGILYKYVKKKKSNSWTDNDEYRIQDLITCICITSIFYNENGKIGQTYDKRKMPSLDEYDYIFTLNYVEFWDEIGRCIHLHGKIDLPNIGDKRNVILVSKGEMNLKEYVEAVRDIEKTNNIIQFYPDDIVFAPSEVEKNKLVCVTGILLSENLYPAEDLFLMHPKNLYTDLDLVDELDIFGMSPYGDKSIIDKLNGKSFVRVFIYNKNESENEETNVWENKLMCKHELVDSCYIK